MLNHAILSDPKPYLHTAAKGVIMQASTYERKHSRRSFMLEAYALFKKEVRLELRSRGAVSSVALFVVISTTTIALATAGERLPPELSSGLLWVVALFGSMTGLSRIFVAEEERGTWFLLKTIAHPTSVYFGKLLYNIALGCGIVALSCLMFWVFSGVEYLSFAALLATVVFGGIALGSGSAIISAIIARAGGKHFLFPILAFPVLLPVLSAGMELSTSLFTGILDSSFYDMLLILISYSGVVTPISSFVFEILWNE